jgi:hypothetical protein
VSTFYPCSFQHVCELIIGLESYGARLGKSVERTEEHNTGCIFLGHRLIAYHHSCRVTGKTWSYCRTDVGALFVSIGYSKAPKVRKAIRKAFRKSKLETLRKAVACT